MRLMLICLTFAPVTIPRDHALSRMLCTQRRTVAMQVFCDFAVFLLGRNRSTGCGAALKEQHLGREVVLPLLVVVMLVICPVFFDMGSLRQLQYLFPPTYYINAVHSNRFMRLMLTYGAALLVVCVFLGKVLKRK